MTKAQLLASTVPASMVQQQSPKATAKPLVRRQGAKPRQRRRVQTAPPRAPPDELVPDPIVWREFHVTSMTLYRWTRDAALDFPPPIKINKRNFRSRRQLEEFKARMVRQALVTRGA